MKTRPRELTALALIFIGIAISFPIQMIWLLGRSPADWTTIPGKLSFSHWGVVALSLALVPVALRASRLFWVLAPGLLGLIFASCWKAMLANPQLSPWCPHVFTLGAILTVAGVIVSPTSRRALTEPRIRWWLTPKRRRVSLDVRVCPVTGGEMTSWTVDLSEQGAFVDLQAADWLRVPRKEIEAGSYCWVRIGLDEAAAISCNAELVRVSRAKGSYPKGAGLRFVGLTASQKRRLQEFLREVDVRESLQAIETAAEAPVAGQA